jgi:UDP-N-acetyl-D-glucosamine dehydrogenase
MDLSIQNAPRDSHKWVGLINSLESCEATIGVIGLGYVGLPVALAFCEAGFNVIGIDVDPERVEPLRGGHSSITDVTDERLARANESGRFAVDCEYSGLAEADAVLICVPTPLTEGIPDVSAITWAGTALREVLKPGAIVVLESTTYPGTTEDVLAPLLSANGKRFGEDFLLAFSPERIDPGNPQYAFEDIPKIVGGADEWSTKVAETLYLKVVPKVVTVSGTREAEMAKLIENTFRHVNIALVNELATYAHAWGIDIWEAIDAAASKPFGYMPFYPGPGWGGHCIPLDPTYPGGSARSTRMRCASSSSRSRSTPRCRATSSSCRTRAERDRGSRSRPLPIAAPRTRRCPASAGSRPTCNATKRRGNGRIVRL